MKCPKCKYTTFDYLDTCPRCGKDISSEKAKLNISSIKPNPPFLLGSLTGDLNDSAFAMKVPEAAEPPLESMSMELKAEDIYDDGSELNIDMGKESPPEPSSSDIDLGDLDSTEGDEDLELDFGAKESSSEPMQGTAEEGEAPVEQELDLGDLDSTEGDEDLELDFGLEDSGAEHGQESAEKPSDSKENEADTDAKKPESEKGSQGIELDLDDLELSIDLDEGKDSEK